MDIVIEFFRDTLDGPFYIVWVVVLVILIFACIGYLAEKGIKNKKEKEKYATVDDTNNTAVVQDTVVSDVSNATQVESSPVTSIAEPASSVPVAEEVSTSGVNNTDAVQNNVINEPEVQTVNSSVVTPTVSEVTTSVNSNNTATVEAPQVEVSQPNNVVTPTVVNPQIEQTTNNTVSTDNVNAPSSEVSQVVIPTINQDGNNNTV
ncbi:MAG TPA: hypothetical protein IAB38_02080 [Candidatus Onthousia excrementipullorum]|uniref:Uncharacterized protein n=1 Tax=Candidatus Onthousia excrementipullorum TaxID=2840884 RepID=A0A9D1DTH3_9FIRM|nr:hypothetical protein [Candidatus Onthousia excrementipullorum]